MNYTCLDGTWKKQVHLYDREGEPYTEWRNCKITEVPLNTLLDEYENIIYELSEKEIQKHNLKETIFKQEQEIIKNTDFNTLYGANNKDVRKSHLDQVLADKYQEKIDLNFSIDYLKRYIGLLKEVVRSKRWQNE